MISSGVFSTDSRHSYEYQLWSSSRRFIPLFARGRLYTGLIKKEEEEKTARSINLTFRYIDYIISLPNSTLGDFVDRIYPIELEIKDAIDTSRYVTYISKLTQVRAA